jgi:hypothetical protein
MTMWQWLGDHPVQSTVVVAIVGLSVFGSAQAFASALADVAKFWLRR